MFESEGPTLTPLKVAYFIVFFVISWLGYAGGPAIQIESQYKHVSWLVAIPVGLAMTWYFQRILVGRLYKAKSGAMLPLGIRASWVAGGIAAGILTMLLPFAVATIANRVIGTTYTASYLVTGKSIGRGKRTCYDLTMTKADDASDRFDVCVPKSEQDATRVGDKMQVTGRRSQYVNQMIRFRRIS
ncbi:hypothetical protein [Paraburkholderia terrae]|uniref:Uncharacterized protein n=1 Tax=Paraburkholderia terrae TaxID=311230 RepID=A0A2I8F1S4_9BURK|nr:hypothetical protein [Paraburkholderia terrae]AUT64964.1 hypothetical protein C2L65_35785 [Paraburkholderia terrae]